MLFSCKTNQPDPASRGPRDASTRRRSIRSTPLVAELEDRKLLSGGAAHVGGVAPVPAVAAAVHRLGGANARHDTLVAHARRPHARAHLSHASPGAPRGTITNPRGASLGGNSAAAGTFSTDGGMALPGTNAGGGPIPSGSLDSFDGGMALPGTNAGGGPIPSGSLDAPDMGAGIPGTSPGGGLQPSGTIVGPINP